jgi:hypothetical protein
VQRIVAFWNRSLINKLIVLAVPFCLCCVPVGAVGNRGRGAAALTPTEVAPTEHIMGGPTELDEPTSTPAPADTPLAQLLTPPAAWGCRALTGRHTTAPRHARWPAASFSTATR